MVITASWTQDKSQELSIKKATTHNYFSKEGET
jgi:hypothetical protein